MKDMEYITIMKIVFMKDFGKKTHLLKLELKNGKMILILKENILKEKKMELEFIIGKMVLIMKVNGKII